MASDTPTVTTERFTGRVKWFNNSTGYGFINIIHGERVGDDVFAHHSGIEVTNEQYKYLVQGEYVSFVLKQTDSDKHEWQACDIKGICEGQLMCETRAEVRASREQHAGEESSNGRRATGYERRQGRGRGRGRGRGQMRRGGRMNERRPVYRGGGPRDGDEWKLVHRDTQQRRTNYNSNQNTGEQ